MSFVSAMNSVASVAKPIASALSSIPVIGGVFDSLFGGGSSVNDQRELMEYQNQLNMDAWREQFSTVSQYNDPKNVASRIKAAGFSPAGAFDNNAVGLSAATNSNSVTGYPAPTKTSSYQDPNYAQGLSSIAQLMSAVSGSKLNEAQANAINEKLFKELRAMDDAHEWQELTNGLLAAYGDKKASAELKLALANVQKAASESHLADEQALTEAKKRLNMDCDIALKELEKDLSGVKLKEAKIDLDYYRKFKEAQLDNLYSQSQENRASATLKSEQVNTEKSVQNVNRFKSECLEIERNFNQATFMTRFRSAMAQLSSVELSNVLKAVEAKDKEAYTTFQRILLGKSTGQDGMRKLLNIIHDIEFMGEFNGGYTPNPIP